MGAERRSMRLDTDDADRTFLPGIVEVGWFPLSWAVLVGRLT